MYGYGYSAYNRLSFLGGIDSNASAFFVATGITDPTIQEAINTLCVDLKKYGVFDKMKAIYPFVGGTATTHKFNLVNSADTDGAFRLSFNGGWTHSSNGALPNGTNAYADTFLNLTTLTNNSTHISYYSRTNTAGSTRAEIGAGSSSSNIYLQMLSRRIGGNYNGDSYYGSSSLNRIDAPVSSSQGYFIDTRTNNVTHKAWRSSALIGSESNIQSDNIASVNLKMYIGARNNSNTADLFTDRQCAFATIGNGLTDTDTANLYYSVQKFQTTLGRQVGTPIYSSNATDVNARLFLGATNIQDATITSAVDTLVQGLKTDGIWTKLKAVYPFVGGTANTHKFNLANALDEDSAFRLSFSGGLFHTSNGVQGNGVNGYFDTFLNPSLVFDSTTGGSMFTYIRNNFQTGADLGAFQSVVNYRLQLSARAFGNFVEGAGLSNNLISESNTDSRGFWGVTRPPSSSTYYLIKNNTSSSRTDTYFEPNSKLFGFVLGFDSTPYPGTYSNHESSFSCVANGLTLAEVANLKTRVQAFQTTLNRQV